MEHGGTLFKDALRVFLPSSRVPKGRKRVNFAVEKPDKHDLSQVVKVNQQWWRTSTVLLARNFAGKNTGVDLPFPSPEELPNPGIEPWFSAWQADSLLFELQGSLPSIWCAEKGTSSAALLPQTPNPSLIMRKTLNPNGGTFYKIADLSILSMKVKSESVSHSVAPDYLWSHGLVVAHQAPLSMEFSRQEY